MKHLIIVFLSISIFNVSAQPSFENRKGGYRIYIPFKWTVVQDGDVTSVYVPDEGEMDVWKEKLEVSITDANDLNLEEAFKFYSEEDVPTMYDGFTILKKGEEEINGVKSKWFLFSFSQSSNVFYNLFYLVLKDKKIFMLQAAAEKTFYPKYESDYLKVVRSFQITK